jgi:hypothetical protein
MGKNEITRRIINSKFEGSRTVGRPKFGGWMVWWKTCGYWGSKDGGWSPGTASLALGLYRELRLIVACSITDDDTY